MPPAVKKPPPSLTQTKTAGFQKPPSPRLETYSEPMVPQRRIISALHLQPASSAASSQGNPVRPVLAWAKLPMVPRHPVPKQAPAPTPQPQVLLTMMNRRVHSRAGFGGKFAQLVQKSVRSQCLLRRELTVDLTNGSRFDWRALVAAMDADIATQVVGPGIVRVCFRILRNRIDANQRSMDPTTHWRHVLDFEQSSGVTYHLTIIIRVARQMLQEWSIQQIFRTGDRLWAATPLPRRREFFHS